MKVNKELLPMKGHFFLFNAGTAPLVPYLSTYAKQLGFSSYIVGIIYTVLPISGLIAKPLFGAIADRYRVQKTLFILFQIVTAITFLGIYFIPEEQIDVKVQVDCGNGESFIKGCGINDTKVGECALYKVTAENSTTNCKMTCDMSHPDMWQTVCEHWHIPQYCYSHTDSFTFTATVDPTKSSKVDQCINFYTDKVLLDGATYIPRCNPTGGLINTNEACTLKCTEPNIVTTYTMDANMTCLQDNTHFTLCNESNGSLGNFFFEKNSTIECEATCNVDKSWRLMEICEGWKADAAKTCQPLNGDILSDYFTFTGVVPLQKTLTIDHCIFFKLQEILLLDGSVHYPSCPSVLPMNHFNPQCTISCDNIEVNELLKDMASNRDQLKSVSQASTQFWLFFFLMIASWVGQAVVVSIADAICFDMLGDKPSAYGRQRLWGSVGWGIFSLLTGVLIDEFSRGSATKNYTVAFVLMFVFLSLDAVVSYTLKYKASKMSINILKDVGSLLNSWHTAVFLLWTVCVGICTGLLWQFLFWHLEDITCTSAGYIKTLQGLVSAIQCYGGEIPFMYLSGPILKRIGHTNMMSIVLLAFGVRFILYSLLSNPWWVLPIEMLQGVTYGMFYPTMTSYASVVAPPGTEATVQGLVGAIFEGIGTSVGSLVGGMVYDTYGGSNTFLSFGCGALVFCFVHLVAQFLLKRYRGEGLAIQQEYSTIIRYAPPSDAIHMLGDNNEMT